MSDRGAATDVKAATALEAAHRIAELHAAVASMLTDLVAAVRDPLCDPAFATQAAGIVADGLCAIFVAHIEEAADAREAAIAARLMATPEALQ